MLPIFESHVHVSLSLSLLLDMALLSFILTVDSVILSPSGDGGGPGPAPEALPSAPGSAGPASWQLGAGALRQREVVSSRVRSFLGSPR